MKLCKSNECTGCMACKNACRKGAIEFLADKEGFLFPMVKQSECIGCGKCRSACPQLQVNEKFNKNDFRQKVYAAWHKDKKIRKESTSGGAFTALANEILNNKGVVYGAGFDVNNRVVHKRITSTKQLNELRGSKYVQSYIGDAFLYVKEDISNGFYVLFSGTPCQIDGLYAFLGNRYFESLFTVDLVCHGVPSPLVYEHYIDYLEKKHDSKIREYYFREKTPGWYVYGTKVLFCNGAKYEKNTYEDPYTRGFLRNYFLRRSCHDCKYTTIHRVSDITLADFWGYRSTQDDNFDDDKGISMVMINTYHGVDLFEKAKQKMKYWEKSLDEAVNGNPALSHSFLPAPNRDQFWEDFGSDSFDTLIQKYLYPEEIPECFVRRSQEIKQHKKHRLKIILHNVAYSVLGEKTFRKIRTKIKK